MAPTSDRLALRLGAIFGFFAVILGAMSAHGAFHDYLDSQKLLDPWNTALNYQFFHALALLAVGQTLIARRATVILWMLGTLCFCGSIYLRSVEPQVLWVHAVTPIGGVLLILGWGWLFLTLLRKPKPTA
jgi:uncharacterized membrane protein YgdD (TMEM256/DUF423 family)